MPIFCSDVNRTCEGKLVPITRHNGASSGPDEHVSAFKLVEGGPENGTVESRKLVPTHFPKVSQSRACQIVSILELSPRLQ